MLPTSEFIVRPMTADDLDQVLVIEQASFLRPWTREHFVGELESRHSFPYVVAAADTGIFGYVCLRSLFEEAQILDIAVDLQHRCKGLARLLMEHAILVAVENNAEILVLEVRASNVTAISLYERLGFIRSGLRQKYYEGREDAILMEKSLKRYPNNQ